MFITIDVVCFLVKVDDSNFAEMIFWIVLALKVSKRAFSSYSEILEVMNTLETGD